MRERTDNPEQLRHSPARVMLTLVLSVATFLFAVAPASASYEQVSTFGGTLVAPIPPAPFPEKAQLGGSSGMAINVTGAGGVPAGTVYVATIDPTHPEGSIRVVRFDPDGTFRMQWTSVTERCGTPEALPACEPHPSATRGAFDLDIDQTTGNVYAFNGEKNSVGAKQIQVFNATGTELITEFGELTKNQTTAASPGKLHGSSGVPGGIAVDPSGNVYVFDINNNDSFRYRLMKFRPQTPGDLTAYVYAGESEDVNPGTIGPGQEAKVPSRPVVDDAGDIYVAGENYIQKLDPSQPTAPPLCSLLVKDSGVRGMNVNPATGEVFFYNYKDRKVHQLSPCSEGTFTEFASLSPTPKRGYAEALAVNPTLKWQPSRAPGVLYGVTPEAVGEAGGGQPGQSSLGYIFAEAELHEPVVESQSVSEVGFTSATLKALVNPKGSATSYVFEYLTDAAYQANEPGDRFAGSSKAPIGGGQLGNGLSPVLASAELSGLAPGTVYHFRVVATSAEGTDSGESETFQTFAFEGPGLPDRRAYELVSPTQKSGGEVFPVNPSIGSCHGECKPGGGSNSFPMQSSPDGGAVVYEGSAFSFGGGAVRENEYLSKRTPSGWQTVPLSPVQQGSGGGLGSKAFNAELTEGIVYQGLPTLAPSAPSGYFNLYRQPSGAPSILDPLLLEAPPNRPPGPSFKPTYAGASADFSRIFFEANDALTGATAFAPAAVDGGEAKDNLYEWVGAQLRLVNVLPGNAEAPAGAAFGRGTPEFDTAQAVLAHAISDDGSHVFWTSDAGQVYVRIDGSETLEIEAPGKFLGASADGSKVLLSDGCLYDLQAAECEDLTEDASEVSKGGFQGILGQSEDLSRIYFVDTAVLTGEEENDHGAKAQAGENNLYAWQEGATTFLATLLPADSAPIVGDWAPAPVQRTAEASPDGRWVAFQSQARLTGYDNTGPCKVVSGTEEVVDGPCTEVFLYDSAAGELRCASCRPSNERPLGSSAVARMLSPEGSLPQPRYLLNSGRLYFDSRDSLSPLDTNDGVEDVYQFEPQGVGSCERASGCVSLISAGRGGVDSNFLTVDATGNNVFFTTRDQLVAADTDELVDLYDARVDGGFPSPPTVGECQGEGCQQMPPVPPEPTPASPNVTDPGNVKPSKGCKKGQIKKKGRCVKKPKHKGKAAKHKRGGSR